MRSNYSQAQAMEVKGDLAEKLQGVIGKEQPALLGLESVVSSRRLDYVVASAQSVMKELDTNDSTLTDGSEVTVSTDAVPIRLGDDDEYHFVRLLQYKKALGRKDPDVYVVFDATEDSEHVLVRNPRAIKVESGDDVPRGVYAEDHNGDVVGNEADDISFVEDIIIKLQKQHDENQVEKATKKAKAKQARSLRARWEKAPFRYKNMSFSARDTVEVVAFYGTLALMGGGIVFGVSKIPGENERAQGKLDVFNQGHHTIESGSQIILGNTANPEFNFDLLHNPELSREEVPNLLQPQDIDLAAEAKVHDIEPVEIDGLRQVELNIEDGVSEMTFPVRLTSQEDTIRAWTDYLGNVNDVEIEVGLDRITIRYIGDTADALLNEDGAIRVVLQHVEAVQVPLRPN